MHWIEALRERVLSQGSGQLRGLAACFRTTRDLLLPKLIAGELDVRALPESEAAALRAGRLMLQEVAQRIAGKHSFAFETTLSGQAHARQIPQWRQRGYFVKLVFLSLPDADMAVARVAGRVAQGGHSIPEAVIRRRFASGLRNFHDRYKGIVNAWTLYDNSGLAPVFIDGDQEA